LVVGFRGLEELRSFLVAGRHAKGLLQPLAGLKTLGAGEAFRLDGRLAQRRDEDFDDSGHQDSSFRVSWPSKRAIARWCFSTALKARRSFLCQRASAARSLSSRARSFWALTWRPKMSLADEAARTICR